MPFSQIVLHLLFLDLFIKFSFLSSFITLRSEFFIFPVSHDQSGARQSLRLTWPTWRQFERFNRSVRAKTRDPPLVHWQWWKLLLSGLQHSTVDLPTGWMVTNVLGVSLYQPTEVWETCLTHDVTRDARDSSSTWCVRWLLLPYI